MTEFNISTFARDLLNFIEEEENKLQNWGYFNVSLSLFDLEHLIAEHGSEKLREQLAICEFEGTSLERVIARMKRLDMLVELEDETCFRSRFAEGVRLTADLKQRFRIDDWISAPRLVSDIKVHLAPRRYPDLTYSAAEVWKDLLEISKKPKFQEKVFYSLARKTDGSFYDFAGFQKRSFEKILSEYGTSSKNATVICAGTGSGKTKAFYTPAFTALALDKVTNPEPFTKIIAIYPRNVLLADQFQEAIAETHKINPILQENGVPPITLGALFGDVPRNLNDESILNSKWRKNGDARRVPYLKAPFHESGCDLIWKDSDRKKNITSLYRVDDPLGTPEIADGIVKLTREEMCKNPPDILFVGLEMLNREISNPAYARLFGIGTTFKPRMLLLDEVHSYSGTAGAQTAWVIARWKTQLRLKAEHGLHIVGLSATLDNAEEHLEKIGCVWSGRATEIKPLEEELTPEGREYTVLVKGNSGSGASLLSTSIQTGMLQARLMTPPDRPLAAADQINSKAFFTRKIFGFTDQLDSVNRWLPDFRNAEQMRLASLRKPSNYGRENWRLADYDGQIWSFPERLGYDLDRQLRLSKCTSQTPGADTSSDMIIATSSLEVGYDDPNVAGIIQHKTPLNVASYLQRKGRAGRIRGSRPISTVVLSDGGRDRFTFANSEQIFSPSLPKLPTPIKNPYVLQSQGALLFVDWLGQKLKREAPFRYLTNKKLTPDEHNCRYAAKKIIGEVLNLGREFDELKKQLQHMIFNSCQFSDFESIELQTAVEAILWHPPRPLITTALPSLLKKLETDWGYADPNMQKVVQDNKINHPMPEFIPSTTFAELTNSEVQIRFATNEGETDGSREQTSRPLNKQLSEAAPGHISKRYSINDADSGFWLLSSELLLEEKHSGIFDADLLFPNSIRIGTKKGYDLRQPTELTLSPRPREVRDSSRSQWVWETDIDFEEQSARNLPIFVKSLASKLFPTSYVFLHSELNSLSITRKTCEAHYDIMLTRKREKHGRVILASDQADATNNLQYIGSMQNVDGIALKLDQGILRQQPTISEADLARLRQQFFLDRLNASTLREQTSYLTLEKLAETSIAMLTATALSNRCSLEEAQIKLKGYRSQSVERVFKTMFGASALTDDETDFESRSQQRVLDLWEDKSLSTMIEETERVLWEPLGTDFDHWMRKVFIKTLSEAVYSAIQSLELECGEEDIIVDYAELDGETYIVISETSPGGVGQIEMLLKEILENEGVFDEAFHFAISNCDRSERSTFLTKVDEHLHLNTDFIGAVQDIRHSRGFTDTEQAIDNLRQVCDNLGLNHSRQEISLILNRVAHAGSSNEADYWRRLFNKFWKKREQQLGSSIDERTFAYIILSPRNRHINAKFERYIAGIIGANPTRAMLFSQIQRFLHPTCHDACPECLSNSNRYDRETKISRELVKFWLLNSLEKKPEVIVADGWEKQLEKLLKQKDQVAVRCADQDLKSVATFIQKVIAQSFERGSIEVWPVVSGTVRDGHDWIITIEIRHLGGPDL